MNTTRIAGTGSYLPERRLTNFDLEKKVETNHEWIVERTGIHSRNIASENENATDLALMASRRALDAANLLAEDVDFILFATVSGDQIMPSSACVLQNKLGCRKIPALDISAACSGFVYGMSLADSLIKSGNYKNILVVGAEVLSRFVNYEDRNTSILFGDGAGAMILQPSDGDSAFHAIDLAADGSLGDLFELPAGGSRLPFSQKVLDEKSHFMRMKGKEIFKNAVRTMNLSCQRVLESSGTKEEEISWLVPHQANARIIDAVAKFFGIANEKVIMNVDQTGNTSAATVPIAFDEAVVDGRIQRGQKILLTAFGAGLTSGSILLTY